MGKVTIQDIARVAGVSKSTVSRVLNGSAPVHPGKRDSVLDAITRLGFQPDIVAQSLANGRSMTFGVLTQIMGSPFYDTIAQGVIVGLESTGYSPIFADGQWETDKQREAIRALLGRRVDGLFLIGGDVPADQILDMCGDIPTVIVARRLRAPHVCVHIDNVAGGYMATQHLIDHGHTRIAIIEGLEEHPDARGRSNGYHSALREAGIPSAPELILGGDFSAESGERAANQLIESGIPFTAIVCANDMTALGARLALYRHGLRVPDDVSLVGYDNQKEVAFMTPPLTTIHQPARKMGMTAAATMLTLIAEEFAESSMVVPELIVRESVAAPARR